MYFLNKYWLLLILSILCVFFVRLVLFWRRVCIMFVLWVDFCCVRCVAVCLLFCLSGSFGCFFGLGRPGRVFLFDCVTVVLLSRLGRVLEIIFGLSLVG